MRRKLERIGLTAYLTVVISILVSACGNLLPPTPQSVDQSIAYGYATLATVRTTTAQLLASNTINVVDAKMVQGLADQARAGLDIAKTYAQGGNLNAAMQAMNLASQVLDRVQTYLAQRKSGGGG